MNGGTIDTPAKRITFTADGRSIEAHEGQSVAAALWAHGDRALSRSMKFHRPRGWSCGTGKCADCTMRVDGVPNVKTCVTPAREGMRVDGQNAWPSVRHDVFRVNDLVFSRGLDHHRAFVRPRFLYPLFGAVMRRFAGWGTLPDEPAPPGKAEVLSPDVLVVGGGPSGCAAAKAAADAGATVVLADEGNRLGGRLTRRGHIVDPDSDRRTAEPAHQIAARWKEQLQVAGVDLRQATTVAATYGDGLVLARSSDRILAIRPTTLIVATGAYDVTGIFDGNDIPGVMTASGCMALVHREGVRPGKRALVYGAGADGLRAARDLQAARVSVVGVYEPRAEPPGPYRLIDALVGAGVAIQTQHTLQRVRGFGRVRRVTLRGPNDRDVHVKADLVVVALGQKTAPEFMQALGCALEHRPMAGGTVPRVDQDGMTSRPGVFACGDAAGIMTIHDARVTGRRAGRAAARYAVDRRERAARPPVVMEART